MDPNGPSLGRKRPRRAAAQQEGHAALQQYVIATHKMQGFTLVSAAIVKHWCNSITKCPGEGRFSSQQEAASKLI